MYLAPDCLDARTLDRTLSNMGRVDSIVIEIDGEDQPRVIAIEVGWIALANRLHPRLARWLTRLVTKWGIGQREPYRIPWGQLERMGNDFKVDVDAENTPARAGERWMREKIIGRIPGS